MNEDISRSVVLACAELDLDCRSYSGRSMYGQDCLGVDCDSPFQTLARILIALAEQGPDGLDAAEHFTRDGAVQTDSMGRGKILYFPRLPWVAREDDEDEPEIDRDENIDELNEP